MGLDLDVLGIKSPIEQQNAWNSEKVVKDSGVVKASSKKEKFILKHQQQLKSLKELIVDLPKKGELFNLLANSQFNSYTFIPYILSRTEIKSLSVVTYSITNKVIDSLMELIKTNKIENLNLFISDHILNRRSDTAKKLIDNYKKYDNVHVGFTHSHAKIIIMDEYSVTGSGNMNSNGRIEQYVLMNSEIASKFYLDNFFKEFSEEFEGKLIEAREEL